MTFPEFMKVLYFYNLLNLWRYFYDLFLNLWRYFYDVTATLIRYFHDHGRSLLCSALSLFVAQVVLLWVRMDGYVSARPDEFHFPVLEIRLLWLDLDLVKTHFPDYPWHRLSSRPFITHSTSLSVRMASVEMTGRYWRCPAEFSSSSLLSDLE